MDIIVPLSNESIFGNDELRFLLRSVERNVCDVGRVIIVTPSVPDWLQNCLVMLHGDPLHDNKDGNMIQKVVDAIDAFRVNGQFCLCCDDYVFMKPCRLSEIPVIYNSRGVDGFSAPGQWNSRMRNTFKWFSEYTGMETDVNFEAHCPQVYDADRISEKIADVNYRKAPGIGICTLFRVLSGWPVVDMVEQSEVKTTHKDIMTASSPLDKAFAGYDDIGFANGIRGRLAVEFGRKSRYER